MGYKNIIFDFGNVLVRFDGDLILGKYCHTPEDLPEMKKAVFYDWNSLDKGIIDYNEYMAYAASIAPPHLREGIAALSKEWYKQLPPLLETWDFVKELKDAGYGLYILSNAPDCFADYAKQYEITRLFDGMVFSGPIQMLKPEPEIYNYLFSTFGLHPEECFFLDDKEENIEGAKKTGMDGVVFTGDIASVKAMLMPVRQ